MESLANRRTDGVLLGCWIQDMIVFRLDLPWREFRVVLQKSYMARGGGLGVLDAGLSGRDRQESSTRGRLISARTGAGD
jgi:hypothetical protein